jgi:ABC-type multidrug transport system fused ATPase/permease subunit
LTFARALVTDPTLLVLDEATSAVDPATEARVQAALARLMQGRTTVTVAHRLVTVRDCDRIVVLAHGRVAEQGSHDELIRQGGLYAGLHALQAVA